MINFEERRKYGVIYHKLDVFDLAISCGYSIPLNDSQYIKPQVIKDEDGRHLLFFLHETNKEPIVGVIGDYLVKKKWNGRCMIISQESFTKAKVAELTKEL